MLDLALYAIAGFVVAYFVTIFGLALGVLRLPAMVQILRVEPRIAVGTNLAIGLLSGVLGMVGRLVHGQVTSWSWG